MSDRAAKLIQTMRGASKSIIGISLVFILAYALIAYVFGQNTQTLRGSALLPPADSPVWRQSVTVSLGKDAYVVPNPYLRQVLKPGRVSIIAMWALLPNLDPLTPETFSKFDDASPKSQVVWISLVDGANYRHPTPKHQLNALIERNLLRNDPESWNYGLAVYPAANTEGFDAKYHEFFFGRYSEDQSVLLDCNREGTVPSAQCTAAVYLDNDVYLQYTYKTAQLGNWRAIDQRLRDFVKTLKQREN